MILSWFWILQKSFARVGRALRGIGNALLGLFFGGCGSLLFFMSFFTNHDYCYNNTNLLFVNPLLLAAVPLGIIAAASRRPETVRKVKRALKLLWTIEFFGCVLSLLIKLLPQFYQQNLATQLLFLPAAIVLSYIPKWSLMAAVSVRALVRKGAK